MCQYHEDNPTVKQTEIGGTLFSFQPSIWMRTDHLPAMFGVERRCVYGFGERAGSSLRLTDCS